MDVYQNKNFEEVEEVSIRTQEALYFKITEQLICWNWATWQLNNYLKHIIAQAIRLCKIALLISVIYVCIVYVKCPNELWSIKNICIYCIIKLATMTLARILFSILAKFFNHNSRQFLPK